MDKIAVDFWKHKSGYSTEVTFKIIGKTYWHLNKCLLEICIKTKVNKIIF